MNEDFLFYLWQFRLWKGELKTLNGELVEVKNPGIKNTHAGPDFLQAKIKIGEVLWVGNVEIHTKTSDWIFHGHQQDKNYEKLILHLVFQHDLPDFEQDFPVVEVKNNIPEALIQNYKILQKPYEFIPCENLIESVDEFVLNQFLETLLIERLEEKIDYLSQRLSLLNGNWEALLFERIAYVFGLKINAEAFEWTAKSFDFKVLQQMVRKKENIESLLFGQAGFLVEFKDDYSQKLAKEYEFLKHKYQLKPIENHLFKFLRLRPPNFPTIRLAQLSALYQKDSQFFQRMIVAENAQELIKYLEQIEPNEYWQNHYVFGKESKSKHSAKLSKMLINNILINAILPIQFLYQKSRGDASIDDFFDKSDTLLADENQIIKNFRKLGIKAKNTTQSQALLQLYKCYCTHKKCVTCRIGNQILNYDAR